MVMIPLHFTVLYNFWVSWHSVRWGLRFERRRLSCPVEAGGVASVHEVPTERREQGPPGPGIFLFAL